MTLPDSPFVASIATSQSPDVIEFPLTWVIETAAPQLQYRAIRDIARLPDPPARLPSIILSHFAALRLAIGQGADGSWNGRMLAIPGRGDDPFLTVGAIPAVHRLLEFGFAPDFPPFGAVRRVLFRLLAEDNDPAYVFEFASEATTAERRRRARLILRESAAAVLAHLGYENDPRLRGCANRMLQRVRDFLESPLSADPWIEVGGKRALSPDASPPSVALVVMLSHMPTYQHENHGFMQQLRAYLERPAISGEVQQQVGSAIVAQPHLLLGNPLAPGAPADGDVVLTLFWLEHFARLGFLGRPKPWGATFDRLLSERGRNGVWHPPKGKLPVASHVPAAWAMYPLDPRREHDAVAAEITWRIGLVARAAGRELAFV